MKKSSLRYKKHSFFYYAWKEIWRDPVASISFCLLCIILYGVFFGSYFVEGDGAKKVNLAMLNQPPSSQNILGTDSSGRDLFAQLILGAKNSFLIGLGVTVFCGMIGVFVGLFAGYFGNTVDNIVMRILDFLSMLPRLMFIIVIVSLVPKYNVVTFVLVMSAFAWIGDARLVRAKTLQQGGLDYVKASKTLGTGNLTIMFREVLPNIGSIIIVNLTLNLAANMGLETGLTFLGFGLPFSTPSLGTLLSYGAIPENMQKRPWQWLPAALLIVIMMLSINFIGQAIKKAADSKQRGNEPI